MLFKKEYKILYDDDEKDLKIKHNYNTGFKSSQIFLISLLFIIATIWIFSIIVSNVVNNSSSKPESCLGSECQKQLCDDVLLNKISGNLCMDLCIAKSLDIPDCSHIASKSAQFYQFEKPESTIVCSLKENKYYLNEGITYSQFQEIIYSKIQKYLNHSSSINKIINKIIDFGDVNRDEEFNLAEANNILTQLNNKWTFFQILFAGKSFASEIKQFCGGCVEIDQILNKVYLKKDSFLETVVNSWGRWPDWNYRAKISIGILEFYLSLLTLNPNDEFGNSSLYLCSSIEKSFGYTFFYEAKVINFDEIINVNELEQSLSNRKCETDLDCVYNDYCTASCNKQTKKCSGFLNKLQVSDYCNFLRKYLLDSKNVTDILEPILDKCETLKPIVNYNNFLYLKNDLPFSWEKQQNFLLNNDYWLKASEYTLVTNELKSVLWNLIKFNKDPVKSTKKTTKGSETTVKNKS